MAIITIPIPDTKDLLYRGCIFYDAPPMITILYDNLSYMRNYHLVYYDNVLHSMRSVVSIRENGILREHDLIRRG